MTDDYIKKTLHFALEECMKDRILHFAKRIKGCFPSKIKDEIGELKKWIVALEDHIDD